MTGLGIDQFPDCIAHCFRDGALRGEVVNHMAQREFCLPASQYLSTWVGGSVARCAVYDCWKEDANYYSYNELIAKWAAQVCKPPISEATSATLFTLPTEGTEDSRGGAWKA
ncbi:hypothetical protein CORC01_09169 [Colletotrichum orchidophilum]|uniref:Uncharacterized protein n=1 Tax=Colletotrichum orchidophilum TaxID=1209926 RepID=A0A1G4B2C2_9PEZI|nr:uncharacterized protein CORC01_09169 [Colletotrichum orchidophilum]OHE95579.1 hypothetical protein CORC01_09169 [Colletotrichum orchidophilum]